MYLQRRHQESHVTLIHFRSEVAVRLFQIVMVITIVIIVITVYLRMSFSLRTYPFHYFIELNFHNRAKAE